MRYVAATGATSWRSKNFEVAKEPSKHSVRKALKSKDNMEMALNTERIGSIHVTFKLFITPKD